MISNILKKFIVLAAVITFGLPSLASDNEITIGYQTISNPWKVAITDGAFEKATGYKIN